MKTPENTLFVVLVWAVAVNSSLARFAGTCTMGAAGNLGGVWLSILFLLIALGLWTRRNLNRLSLALAAAAMPVLAFHAVFGSQLAIGVLQGRSACTILMAMDYLPDGDEAIFATLWAAQAVLIVFLLLAIFADWRRGLR